jgi:hypothetical protein
MKAVRSNVALNNAEEEDHTYQISETGDPKWRNFAGFVRLITRLLLCEISSSHGGEYDVQNCLLGYTAV